jgi:hypothetical protein
MKDKVDKVKIAVMLLNRSLKSFRSIFADQIKSLYASFGSEPPSDADLDIVVDVEIRLFGNDTKLIHPFNINDYSFIDDPSNQRPEIDPDQGTINNIMAFQAINATEGTYDRTSWERVVIGHGPEIQKLIHSGAMTEVVIQISDGATFSGGTHDRAVRREVNRIYNAMYPGQKMPRDDNEATKNLIELIREKMAIGIAGFAIGRDKDEAEKARIALTEKIGDEDLVITASSVDDIVSQWGELLKKVVVQQIEEPMLQNLEKIEEAL